jgi:PRTRC genetic system ThiF family protein
VPDANSAPSFKHTLRANVGLGGTAPISVVLVGAGGNGSLMLGHLARIHTALVRARIHPPGLSVSVIDDDTVSEANLGRQAFSPSDLGMAKASILVQRTNLFFGTNWQAHVARFNAGTVGHLHAGTIVISCVDTIASRLSVWRALRKCRCYWMDLGNTAHSGQVVLGETEGEFVKGSGRKARLPHLFDLFPRVRRQKDKPTEPSCSLVEALERQDLFINSTLANFAGHTLWQLLRHGGLNHQGVFLNLKTGRTVPIEIQSHV